MYTFNGEIFFRGLRTFLRKYLCKYSTSGESQVADLAIACMLIKQDTKQYEKKTL